MTHECRHIFYTDNQDYQRHQIVWHDSLSMRVTCGSISPSESQECHYAETHHRRAQDLNDAGERDTESRVHGRGAREKEKKVQDDCGVKEEDVRRNRV